MYRPRLGVSYNIVADGLDREALEAVRGSRIATVEMPAAFFHPGRTIEQQKVVRETLTADGDTRVASVHARFGGPFDLSSAEDQVARQAVDEILSSMDLAVALGADIVVVHLSAEPIESHERPDCLARARERLSQIEPRAREAGLRVAPELLPRTCLGNTAEELVELLDALDAKVFGACLDVNHLMDRYEGLPDVVRQLDRRLIALHLSDYDGVDEKHWMPGEGVIDWAAFMAALRTIEYDGPFNYESKPAGATPEERIRDCEENFAWLSGLYERVGVPHGPNR